MNSAHAHAQQKCTRDNSGCFHRQNFDEKESGASRERCRCSGFSEHAGPGSPGGSCTVTGTSLSRHWYGSGVLRLVMRSLVESCFKQRSHQRSEWLNRTLWQCSALVPFVGGGGSRPLQYHVFTADRLLRNAQIKLSSFFF